MWAIGAILILAGALLLVSLAPPAGPLVGRFHRERRNFPIWTIVIAVGLVVAGLYAADANRFQPSNNQAPPEPSATVGTTAPVPPAIATGFARTRSRIETREAETLTSIAGDAETAP